ncbi:hypothetical protein L204_104488 [Cryptococcus depauperatus]
MSEGRLPAGEENVSGQEGDRKRAKLIKRMRLQIWAGTLVGFFIALCIGAAFIAVVGAVDRFELIEKIWEGVFSIIAAGIIYVGVGRMDRSRVKWRLKLAAAFDRSQAKMLREETEHGPAVAEQKEKSGKWALFILPLVTVLREGLEAVVALSLPATSIPLAVVVGLIAGFAVGYIIYRTGSTTTLHWFLVGSTSLLCLIGAGLFSKGVGYFEYYRFAKAVGGDVAEAGDGPGSFQVAGNVWHLTYGNPEAGSPTTNGGWQIFNAILGWNNTATLGSILSYVFYWILVAATLVVLKWKEGRFVFFGYKSAALQRREARRERAAECVVDEEKKVNREVVAEECNVSL